MKASAFALVVALAFGLSGRDQSGPLAWADDATRIQAASTATWIARTGSGGSPPFANPTLHLRRVSLRQLIGLAYARTPARMSGGPAWIDEREWEVAVLADRGAPYSTVRALVRDMLTARFQLRVTPAMRRVPTLLLSFEHAASADGLRPARAKVDCAPFIDDVRSPLDAPRGADGLTLCGPSTVRDDGLYLRSAPLDAFARELEILLGQVVLVSPPKAGLFDIDFAWPHGYAEHDPTPDVDTFVTSVERQLGASAHVQSTNVQILVITSAARPALGGQ